MATPTTSATHTPSSRQTAAEPQPYPSAVAHLDDVRALVKQTGRLHALREALHGDSHRFRHAPDPDVAAGRLPAVERGLADLTQRIAARVAATAAAGTPLPIDLLCERLGLTSFDRTVLLLSAVKALDLSVEDDFGNICETTGHGLSVMTVMQFLGLSLEAQLEARARFRADAPLRSRDLITLGMSLRATAPEDLLRADLSLTPQSLALLLGDDRLSDELVEFSSIEAPLAAFDRVVLPTEDRERILAIVDGHERWPEARAGWGLDQTITYGRGSFLLFSGPPGTGKTLTAHAVADRLGKQVLAVDIPTLVEHVDNMRLLPGLFREARLRDAMLFFDECETFFASRQSGNQLMSLLLTELERYEGVAVLATNLPEALDEALFRRLLVHVRFEAPRADARAEIWRQHLPDAAPLDEGVDLDALARRYALTGGQVKNAVLNACARAFTTRGNAGPVLHADLERAARDQLRPLTDDEEAASARWSEVRLSDVHLPEHLHDELRQFLGFANQARLIQEEWGIARGETHAQVLLLHGPPGTGKSFCARALAGELGRPLLRVAVGGLRSKWVGQSETNLTRLFRRSHRENAVLLLDEVDALVATRGDSRSAHHDDVLTSTLLTLLDTHDGVVVLTTNRPQCLDPALARRIGWHLELPLPSADARRAIWRAMLPETAPLHPSLDLDDLAQRHALTGGDIRTLAVRAAALAATEGTLVTNALLNALASGMVASASSGRGLLGTAAVA